VSDANAPEPPTDTPESRRRARDRAERGVGYRMFGIGYTSVSEAIAGLLIGAGVDWAFGTGPWGLVVGGVAGIGVAMWSLVRNGLRLQASLGTRIEAKEGGTKREVR